MWFDTSLPDTFIQTWVINDPIGQTVANLTLSADKSQVTALLAEAQAKLLKVWLMLCFAVLLILTPILLYVFSRLDRIISAAQAILQGKEVDKKTWQRSEICDLATQIVESGQAPQTNKR
jgi:ATP/ADP translocase